MTAVLREMRPEDLDRVVELEPILFGLGAWSRAVYAGEVGRADRRYVVAVADDVVVGYAGIALAHECSVMTIGVAPGYRRCGLGAQLLQDLVEAARAVRAESVFLEVRAQDEVAQHMYRSFGFDPLGIRPGYYQPEGADALVMRLPLDAPASRRIGPLGAERDEE